MAAALVRTFVVVNACPGEGADQVFLRSGNEAVLVGVFKPEDELPPVPTDVDLLNITASYITVGGGG